jgi:hypothetical protein
MLAAGACQMELTAPDQNIAKEYISFNDQAFFVLLMVMSR